jgi:hypothetical protein
VSAGSVWIPGSFDRIVLPSSESLTVVSLAEPAATPAAPVEPEFLTVVEEQLRSVTERPRMIVRNCIAR